MLPLRGFGLQQNEFNRLNLLLRTRANTRGGYDVQAAAMTSELVDAAQGLGLDCAADTLGCATELGRIADVAFVLLGAAATAGDDGVGVDVSLVDVAAGVVVRRVRALLPASADARTDATNALADVIFQGGAMGSVVVNVGVAATVGVGVGAEAEVTVDGLVVDAQKPITGLAAGRHVLEVKAKRYISQRLPLLIQQGENAPVAIVLQIDPDAEVAVIGDDVVIVPFIAAGVSAVVAVAGGVMLGIGLQPYFAYQDANAELDGLDQGAAGYPSLAEKAHQDSATAIEQWEGYGSALTVSGGVALGLGVTAAIATVAWGTALALSPPEERSP